MYEHAVVSVVIATNRDSPFLANAVQSVRNQSVPVGEVILVDDGAPADLEPFAVRNGLQFCRQAAAGVSAARNLGAARARGEWIAFLDDDDEWHPDWLAHQLRALTASPHAIAAFTGGWHMDAAGERFGTVLSARGMTRREMLSGAAPLPRLGAMLIRHLQFDRVGGFRMGIDRAEDDILILGLLEHGDFAATDIPLWGYRRHDSNVTNDRFPGIRANVFAARLLLREARARKDDSLTALYAAHLKRAKQRAAADGVGAVVDSVRGGHPVRALRIGTWMLTRMPLLTIRNLITRATGASRWDRRGGPN